MVNNYTTRFKNLLFLSLLTLITSVTMAQTTAFGPTTPAAADDRKPLGVYFGYERSQFIYTPAEFAPALATGSIITNVAFFLSTTNVPPGFAYDIKVYMKEVPSTTVTSNTWANLTGASVLVFNGSMATSNWTTPGTWVNIALTNNQVTTGSNIEFLVETNWAGSASTGFDGNGWFGSAPGGPGFFNSIMFTQNTKTASGQYWDQDNVPPSGNGSVQNRRPNIRIISVLAPPCSANPTGVTANASANPVCAVPFTLTLSGLPPQSGFSFQWYSSTTSAVAGFTAIPGATNSYYQATQGVTTWYYCEIKCGPGPVVQGTGNPSSVVQVTQNPVTNCYCPSGATSTQDTDIGNVTFGTINNVAGGCTPTNNNGTAGGTYSNFTSSVLAPNLQQGTTYPFSMCQITSFNTFYAAWGHVFIDYNIDGVFDPVSERVFTNGFTSLGAPTLNGPITIPYSTAIGTTRMRVILREQDAGGGPGNDPCGTYAWGETEDYNVNLIAGPPCTTPVVAGTAVSTAYDVCPLQSFTLSITGNTSIGSGQKWQWEKSTTGCLGSWSITGVSDTLTTLTIASQAVTTWYRCKITCNRCCSTVLGYTACAQVNSNPSNLCYCNQQNNGTILHGFDCSSSFINTVQITPTTLNNANTGCTSGNATAYTIYAASGSTTATIVQGTTYNLTVATGGSAQSISVWIDFNGSGTFDATEWYGVTGTPATVQAAGTYTIPITIPTTFPFTGLTGMRVRSRINTLNGSGDACTNFGSGETEDYFVTINPPTYPFCDGTFPGTTTVTTVAKDTACSGSPINLTLTPTPISGLNMQGLSYQWQLDTIPGGVPTWQNISGATNKTLTTSQTRYTCYRCVITCTGFGGIINSSRVCVVNRPATWLGGSGSTASNDWSNPANWCGRVPTLSDSVQVAKWAAAAYRSVTSTNYVGPVVQSGMAVSAYMLQIAPTDTLKLLTDSLTGGFTVLQVLNDSGVVNTTNIQADTAAFSNGGLAIGSVLPFKGGTYEEVSQIIFSANELAASGLKRNDIIDSLFFHFKSRASIRPYEQFRISYGLTSQDQFTSTAKIDTQYTGAPLTQIYFNASLPIYTMVPGASGTLKLPVTGFQYSDTTKNIVLQICFNSLTNNPGGNDQTYYTVMGLKTYLQIENASIAQDGCVLVQGTNGSTAGFTPTVNRPNVTFRFHRPQKTLTANVGSAPFSGGGLKMPSTGKLYLSNTNFSVLNGTPANDGLISLDKSTFTTSLDFVNNVAGIVDMGYKPSGIQYTSTFNVNGAAGLTNSGTITTSDDVINVNNAASTVNNSGTLNLDSTLFTIAGTYTNGGITNLAYAPTGSQRKSTIFFNGVNWNNNGTFTPGIKSRVVFGGASNQNLGGTQSTTFWDFRMEKGASTQTITLFNPITINDSVSLGNGRIIMNYNNITFNNSTASAMKRDAGAANFTPNGILVSDTLAKFKWYIGAILGTHSIPFGNPTYANNGYIPFTINMTAAGNLDTVSVLTYGTPANNLPYPNGVAHLNDTLGANNSAKTVDRFWVVSKSSGSTPATNLTFAFSDGERPANMNSTGVDQGKAQPWGQAGGWRAAPGTQTYSLANIGLCSFALPSACTYRVNIVNVTGYIWNFGNSNPWTIANASSPLPISLLNFNAKAIEDKVHINWETASEKDNDYFTVQRTNDFSTHIDIAQVPSHGNSNDVEEYDTWDNNPKTGLNYYRLLQTDIGGSAKPVSDYVAVRFGVKSTFEILYVTNESEVEVIYDYDSEENVDYTVTDMLGKTMAIGLNTPAAPGVNIIKLDASAWPHGMYMITLQNSEKKVTHKLVY